MPDTIYIGNSQRQDTIASELVTGLRSKPDGIWVVAGVSRSGKDTLLDKVGEQLHVPVFGLGSEMASDLDWSLPPLLKKQLDMRHTVIIAKEISSTSDLWVLKKLCSEYRKEYGPFAFLFNTMIPFSRSHIPAWENTDLEKFSRRELQGALGKDSHIFFLPTDPKRIHDEIWRGITENRAYLGYFINMGLDIDQRRNEKLWLGIIKAGLELKNRSLFEQLLGELEGKSSHSALERLVVGMKERLS